MITFSPPGPRFGATSQPGGDRNLPDVPSIRTKNLTARPYIDVARRAWSAFPLATRRFFQQEGVVLVLSGQKPKPGTEGADSLSPFVYSPGSASEDEKQVIVSPNQGGDAWMSRDRFRLQVIQALAQTLRASSVEMLFDESLQNAFDADFMSVDQRLGMLAQGSLQDGMESVDGMKVLDLRHQMAEGRGGMQAMLEVMGYCIAEYCTGESQLNALLPGLNRPAESLFPALYNAIIPHMPALDSAFDDFMSRNKKFDTRLTDPEKAIIKNLLSDPLTPLHGEPDVQKCYASLAAQSVGLLMEDTPADERRKQFYEPFHDIANQTWSLWRKLFDAKAVMNDEEHIKLASCGDRATLLLKALKKELPKENRYIDGNTARFFGDLEREFQLDPQAEINIYEYVATVMGALPQYQDKAGAEALAQTIRLLNMRLEASGDDLASRACDKLLMVLEAKAGAL